jgi:hypothetical protein
MKSCFLIVPSLQTIYCFVENLGKERRSVDVASHNDVVVVLRWGD